MKQDTAIWQVQDAKARFSELLDRAIDDGPQIITRRGVEAAVMVPIEEWRRLQNLAGVTLKDLLLAEAPRADIPVPPRGKLRSRPSPDLA